MLTRIWHFDSRGGKTYWFWHPWACAGNRSGCPWVGHANASRIFDSYLVTVAVGRGAVLNMNIPPERTGRINASVVRVMAGAGAAINATFRVAVAALAAPVSGDCTSDFARLTLPRGGAMGGAAFDYVVTMEDMAHGARVANYSVEYRAEGSDAGCPGAARSRQEERLVVVGLGIVVAAAGRPLRRLELCNVNSECQR